MMATVTYHTISTQQPTYLVNLLHFSDIYKTTRLFVSKQLVPKTMLNIGKHAFSHFIQISKYICLKLLFHHTYLAVLCSNDDFDLSPFMTTPNDFVCCASEHEFSRI